MRIAGCILADLVCPYVSGIAGTGGASAAGGLCPRFGDGSRNVLSDMEALLSLRSSIEFGRPDTEPVRELETELLRRIMRFVCTSATLVGVVGRERNAAPAAAAARPELLFDWARKAWAAADVAAASTVALLTL